MFVNDLLLVFGVYFQGYEDIFDELFDYLKTATRTGETAALPQVFHQVSQHHGEVWSLLDKDT